MCNIINTRGDGLNFYGAYLYIITLIAAKASLLLKKNKEIRPASCAVQMPLTCSKTVKKNPNDPTAGKAGGEYDAARATLALAWNTYL